MSCCFEQIKSVSLKFVTMPLFLMKKKTFTFYIQMQFFYFSYMTAIIRGDWKYIF